MSYTFDKLMQLQGHENPGKPMERGVGKQSSKLEESKKAILQALQCGANTKALALSLQAIGDGDAAFMDKVSEYMQPSAPGEEWKMAYRAYARFDGELDRIIAQDNLSPDQTSDRLYDLSRELSKECADIYNIGGGAAKYLAFAVSDAIGTRETAFLKAKEGQIRLHSGL